MPERDFRYRIDAVRKVVDGDTFDLRLEFRQPVDVGFHIPGEYVAYPLIRCRLLGYDTPEIHGRTPAEKAAAKQAAEFSADWLAVNAGALWVRTEPDPDDFGRWLGDIYTPNGGEVHLGSLLAAHGLASVWPARWRDVFSVKLD